MTDTTKTFLEEVQFVDSILSEDFDFEAHDYPEFDDEFRDLITPTSDALDGKEYVESGSYRPDDPVSAMYRLLWLIQPKQVDFSDMYKTELFAFASKDGQVIVSVYLFEYEPALYFYVRRSLVDTSKVSAVWGGFPGCNNGVSVTNETAKAFIELVKHAANTEHMIYGGNNFEV